MAALLFPGLDAAGAASSSPALSDLEAEADARCTAHVAALERTALAPSDLEICLGALQVHATGASAAVQARIAHARCAAAANAELAAAAQLRKCEAAADRPKRAARGGHLRGSGLFAVIEEDDEEDADDDADDATLTVRAWAAAADAARAAAARERANAARGALLGKLGPS